MSKRDLNFGESVPSCNVLRLCLSLRDSLRAAVELIGFTCTSADEMAPEAWEAAGYGLLLGMVLIIGLQ